MDNFFSVFIFLLSISCCCCCCPFFVLFFFVDISIVVQRHTPHLSVQCLSCHVCHVCVLLIYIDINYALFDRFLCPYSMLILVHVTEMLFMLNTLKNIPVLCTLFLFVYLCIATCSFFFFFLSLRYFVNCLERL